MHNVLVTGANGFVGTALCKKLLSKKFYVRGAVQLEKTSFLPEKVAPVYIKSIDSDTKWDDALTGIDKIGRAHV